MSRSTQLDKHIRNEETMKLKKKKMKIQKKITELKKPRKLSYKFKKKIIQSKSEIKKLLLINLANNVKHPLNFNYT